MLDKLKSLFIVEEEQSSNQQADKTTKEVDSKTDRERSTVRESARTGGNVDQKITEKLLSAIDKTNLEGFDYLEYKNALKALEKIPMDEATRFRSAFATAATIGATLDKLVESAKFYIGVLDKENQTFLKSYDIQLKENISDKEAKVVDFEKVIQTKSDQIAQLTREIQLHQNEIMAIRAKLVETKSMMEQTQENFKVSYMNLRSHLEGDIAKMNEYLK